MVLDIVNDFDQAKRMIEVFMYDVILLDRDINKQDIGMHLIKTIRASEANIGIIVLSAYSTADDKIDGLELGADDYMEKPFNIKELSARIHALHRRNLPILIKVGSVVFDTSQKRIFDNDNEIFLTNKENELLFYLLIHRNQVVSHEQLLNALYLHPEEITSNTINVRINTIRKKLPIDFIKSIKTRGYIIEI
jgi:two-component system OmpR family response regulator